ncbi:hypothetical protein BM221_001054 [Beauveria bassiana]|uniref:Uncharacterized protein n=1 Tax=Beauveria bassiana TaxID=176275 RepID=A0A2N6P280_BEABA|nr:hypothetical protein BM221_001054 [Beauveria bassiana]
MRIARRAAEGVGVSYSGNAKAGILTTNIAMEFRSFFSNTQRLPSSATGAENPLHLGGAYDELEQPIMQLPLLH